MNTEFEEMYVSLRIAHGDMEQVLNLIKLARNASNNAVKFYLLQHAIIVYSRPFGKINGKFRKRFITLKELDVFGSGNENHRAIIKERDERIAHGDITNYDPKLWHLSGDMSFPILLKPSQLYCNKEELMNTIENLAHTTTLHLIDKMNILKETFNEHNKRG